MDLNGLLRDMPIHVALCNSALGFSILPCSPPLGYCFQKLASVTKALLQQRNLLALLGTIPYIFGPQFLPLYYGDNDMSATSLACWFRWLVSSMATSKSTCVPASEPPVPLPPCPSHKTHYLKGEGGLLSLLLPAVALNPCLHMFRKHLFTCNWVVLLVKSQHEHSPPGLWIRV